MVPKSVQHRISIDASNSFQLCITHITIYNNSLISHEYVEAFAPSLAVLWPLSCLYHLWLKWQRHISLHENYFKLVLNTKFIY